MREVLLLMVLLVGDPDQPFYAGDVAWIEEPKGLNADWTAYGYVLIDYSEESDE